MTSTSLEEKSKCCDYENCPAYVYCWDDSRNKFPPIRTFFLIGAFLFYLLDIGLDIWLAYEHYLAAQNGDGPSNYYFQATLFFIIVPIVMINFLSWGLYAWSWMTFRVEKVKNYCTSHVVPMHDFHVIRWPWYLRSKSKQNRTSRTSPNRQDRDLRLNSLSPMKLEEGVKLKKEFSNSETTFTKERTSPDSRNKSLSPEGFVSPTEQAKSFHFPRLTVRTHSRNDSMTMPIISAEELPDTDEPDSHLEFYPLDFFHTSEFVVVTIIHILQLGYVFRVIRLLYKRKQDKYSFDRYRDLSFLRLMEAFLESAPQFVLQLYIATVKTETRLAYNIITPLSLIASVCSLALAVGDYISAAKDLHYYDPPPNHTRKSRLTWTGYFIIIFWHLCMIAGRGVTLALFTSIFGRYLFLIIGIHYFAMVYWMYWQHAYVFIKSSDDYYMSYWDRGRRGSGVRLKQPKWKEMRSLKSCLDARNHICRNYGIEFIVAAFNLFFHFKIKEGSSVQTLVPFYVITFVENTLMILLWYYSRDFEIQLWYSTLAPVTVFVTFFIGLGLVVVYYYKYQPSKEPSLEVDPDLEHPTMTCTLNRLYTDKEEKGNVFERIYKTCSQRDH